MSDALVPRRPLLDGRRARRAREAAGRMVRSREGDPSWSRPALLGVAALAGVLMLWSLTASGYANTYYASAVYAGSRSWSAFFHNSIDLSQYVSIDKTPLAVWMMSLSARVFGFSSLSMLLPNALCGVASVVVLHDAVRRTLGHRAAIVAALMLALTPVTVLMNRFNNPDALLVLLLVCAAWATVRALETGRTRHLLLVGVIVGLAFNAKMLQAYLVLPALAIPYLYAGQGRVRRRLAQLLGASAAMVAVSAAWVGTMMLIPASQRPFVGDTAHNSWWELIFGANGLDRVGSSGIGAGPGGSGGFGGSQGALRLFNAEVGGQIAWLLPLAALGLVTGLWTYRRAARTHRPRAAYVLWGTWALVHFAIFSFSLNLFHPYYTSALAPAVAALAGGGAVLLWDRRAAWLSRAALAVGLLATATLAVALLGRTPSFALWLRWLVLGAGLLAAAGLVLGGRRGRVLVVVLAGVAVLAAPAAYSVATVGQPLSGGNPTAGPPAPGGGPGSAITRGARPAGAPPAGFGGPPPGGFAGRPPTGFTGRPSTGPPPAFAGRGPGGIEGAAADKGLIPYLEAHQGSAQYLVAANGSMSAAPIILASHRQVITMGGFSGQDPSPSVNQLKQLVAGGRLRYVLSGGGVAGRGPGGPRIPGASANGSQARDAWVMKSCKASSGHSGLYDCAGAR